MTYAEREAFESSSGIAAVAGREGFAADAEIPVVGRPACFLCGNTGEELYKNTTDWLFGAPGRWEWRRCVACEVLWLDPQPRTEDIPKLYARYYTHSSPLRPPSFHSLRRKTLEYELARLGYRVETSTQLLPRLLSRIPPIARANAMEVLNLPASEVGTLLDVGCGNGQFIGKMRSLGWTVSGVDPDPAAVAYGRSKGFQVFQGTIDVVPRDVRYDVIALSHVIEHVADPVALLQECKQRVKRGTGRIVLTTPNVAGMGHRWFKQFWRGLEVPRHLVLFSPKGMGLCLYRAGLRLQSLSTETRIAVRIHNASACAREGNHNISERTTFSPKTKIAGYFFMALENALIYLNKNLGEELFCICMAE